MFGLRFLHATASFIPYREPDINVEPCHGSLPLDAGCYSETGKLRKVLMCAPTYFQIVKPINVVQWLYYCDGLPKPEPPIMELQHARFVRLLREHGVEVELVPAHADLPYQHATRDVGTVIGDTIVLSNLKEPSRQLEAELHPLSIAAR